MDEKNSTSNSNEITEVKEEYNRRKVSKKVAILIGCFVILPLVFCVITALITIGGVSRTYKSDSAIQEKSEVIRSTISEYKSYSESGYSFSIDTVSYNQGNRIHTRSEGIELRKVNSDNVQFHNDIQISSNLDDDYLYKSIGFVDGHGGMRTLSNNEVHSYRYEKNETTSDVVVDVGVADYSDSDKFYMFDAFDYVEDIEKIEEKNVSINQETTYTVKSKSGFKILDYFNNNYRVDVTKSCSETIKVFGDIDETSLSITSFSYSLKLKRGRFISLDYVMRGNFTYKLPYSLDCTNSTNSDFEFSCRIKESSRKFGLVDKIS